MCTQIPVFIMMVVQCVFSSMCMEQEAKIEELMKLSRGVNYE